MKLEESLPCPQKPATCIYSVPDKCSIGHAVSFNIIRLRLGLPSGFFPSSFPHKNHICSFS